MCIYIHKYIYRERDTYIGRKRERERKETETEKEREEEGTKVRHATSNLGEMGMPPPT